MKPRRRTIRRLMDLSGRRALVTGGGGHVGLAAAESLAELGARIAILDIDERAGCRSVRRLSTIRKNCATPFICDLKDEHATRRTIRSAIRQMGGLEILIHCAALVGADKLPGWAVPFEDQTVDAWDAALRINLTSAMVMAQEAKSALAKSGHGSIILFGSIYGVTGVDFGLYKGTSMANPAAYGASKGGLLQLMRYLTTLFAPHIRVNTVSPGGIWRHQPERFHRRYTSKVPLGRMATEEDLKGAVAYLAGDLSAYVTGQNILVDGGWTAW